MELTVLYRLDPTGDERALDTADAVFSARCLLLDGVERVVPRLGAR